MTAAAPCTCPRIDGYRIKRTTCPVHGNAGAPSSPVTTEEAAALLEVPAGLISQWKHRGRVTPISYTTVGNAPVYDLAELEAPARAYHQRARRGGRT